MEVILSILLQIFFANLRGKSVYEQLTVHWVGCSLFSVHWHNFMNEQTCSLFFNNQKRLSHLKLILNEDLT